MSSLNRDGYHRGKVDQFTMATRNEHERLIADAATAALPPLGCKPRGRSRRRWYSDQGYWAIGIEFQPSGWSKGSYLNVGATWLWHAKPYWSYDYGCRVADFIPFESEHQFRPLIADMAAQAAREVLALHRKFASFSDIHRTLLALPPVRWNSYHAAVAAGLAGDVKLAKGLFHRFHAWATSPEHATVQSESLALAELLGNPVKFRVAISALIAQRRTAIKLPPDAHCLDVVATTAR